MIQPEYINSVDCVKSKYDLFLLDQWGVLHNGVSAHLGAVNAMAEIKAAGKKIILVSNSSRRISSSINGLNKLGITRNLYDHILTSGELAWEAMKDDKDPFYKEFEGKCYIIGKDGRQDFLNGLKLKPVSCIDTADFLLVGDLPDGPIEGLLPVLGNARARDLTMVVLNPDMISIDATGKLNPCPGQVGEAYSKLGGTVKIHGKPDHCVYEKCFELEPEARSILAIGDSLHHDIAGACNAGIDSVLITSGIHVFDLKTVPGSKAKQLEVNKLCSNTGITPTFWGTRFV